MDALINAINNTPIIDHHAHNLLLLNELSARQFLSITSEAEGQAQAHITSTQSHLRAVKQLSKALNCEATWPAVEQAVRQAREQPSDAWARYCFKGIYTILIDDGLDNDTVFPWDWHNGLVPTPCKRIVRIEVVAEKIVQKLLTGILKLRSHDDLPAAVAKLDLDAEKILLLAQQWFTEFSCAIVQANQDPTVAGFKSIICYRTGLKIPDDLAHLKDPKAVLETMRIWLGSNTFPRLQDDILNPWFVHLTAKTLSDKSTVNASGPAKPFQFHTGLGDIDIRLNLASPSHMQPFIEQYPHVPIVLLHAAYPFTKEAGYLASVYANCYLDIGEVFPFVSQAGQETVIRESLELCPSEKLMWSTDGHWYPETYLLAVLQVKEGLSAVGFDVVVSKFNIVNMLSGP